MPLLRFNTGKQEKSGIQTGIKIRNQNMNRHFRSVHHPRINPNPKPNVYFNLLQNLCLCCCILIFLFGIITQEIICLCCPMLRSNEHAPQDSQFLSLAVDIVSDKIFGRRRGLSRWGSHSKMRAEANQEFP